MEEFNEWGSQRFGDDDFLIVADNSIDHMQVFPTIVVVGINWLQIFGVFRMIASLTRRKCGSFMVITASKCSLMRFPTASDSLISSGVFVSLRRSLISDAVLGTIELVASSSVARVVIPGTALSDGSGM